MEIPASTEHRNIARAELIEHWRNPSDIKIDLSTLALAADMVRQTPAERDRRRGDVQSLILSAMPAQMNPYERWLMAAYGQAHQPIAPGNPPLTEKMVWRYINHLFWLLEIPNSGVADTISSIPFVNYLRDMLIADWKNQAEIKKDVDFLNWQEDVDKRIPEEREYIRSQVQSKMVASLRADVRRDAKRILAVYDEAHPTIAAGNPPLTRQAVDAFTEHLCFTQNEAGGPHLECTQALKDSYAQQFAQTYGTLTPEQRKNLVQMPQTWALLRVGWATSGEDVREQLRARWRSNVQSGGAVNPHLNAELAASARVQAFTKRDPATVSEQELLEAAKDADTAARECRLVGGEQGLATAASWERAAASLRVGKAAYMQQMSVQGLAQKQIGDMMLLNMQLRMHQESARVMRGALNNIGGSSGSYLGICGMSASEAINRFHPY